MSNLAEAVSVLEAGGLVVYPTETVYGLGVDATSSEALSALLALKGRSSGTGVSLLVPGLSAARELVEGRVPGPAVSLAARFWCLVPVALSNKWSPTFNFQLLTPRPYSAMK